MKKRKDNQKLDIHGQPIKADKKKVKKRDIKDLSPNKGLLNLITPIGLDFKRSELEVGENIGRAYGGIKYPQYPNYCWLTKPLGIHGTVAALHFNPIDNVSFMDALNQTILNSRNVIIDGGRNSLDIIRAKQTVENAERIMADIDQNGESVGEVGFTIMPLAPTRQSFNRLSRKMESTLKIAKLQFRKLPNLQKQGFMSISPTHAETNKVDQMVNRVMQIKTIMGGFPFAAGGFTDGIDIPMGLDSQDGDVKIYSWMSKGDRGNHNLVFTGDSGQGKSTTIKKMALLEYAQGTQIIFVDPEAEYRELTEKLGGEWIDATSRSGKTINPLQIFQSKLSASDDAEEGYGMLDLQLQRNEVFFRLYFTEITELQLKVLRKESIKMYEARGITWDTDTSTFANDAFPVFSELYEVLQKEYDRLKDRPQDQKIAEEYKTLLILLEDLCYGADSKLCGHHTTLDSQAEVICIDTSNLNTAPKNIQTAQYY
ncbi:TraG/VirB4 family ATPase, partial [Eubacterium aggregans]|uniref:TraG/VirB4 family ATPase n=1 Tax=Eubacterium aggregans TaxID=81409 RepID=UPI003F2EBD9E